MDFGLLSGLAEGIKQGTQSYAQARQNRLAEEEALERRKMQQEQLSQEAGLKERQFGFDERKLEQDAALKREEMANAIRLKGMEMSGKKADKAVELAKETKGKILPGGEVSTVAEANSILGQLDDLDQSFEGKSTVGRGMVPSLKRGVARATGLLGASESLDELQGLESKQGQMAQIVGKYLEGGKLTDADISRYQKQLPQTTDSPDVRRQKVASLKQLISARQQALAKGFGEAGYDVSGLTLGNPNQKGLIADQKSAGNSDLLQQLLAEKERRKNALPAR